MFLTIPFQVAALTGPFTNMTQSEACQQFDSEVSGCGIRVNLGENFYQTTHLLSKGVSGSLSFGSQLQV